MLIDAKAIVVDGMPFTVKLMKDDQSMPTDYDCYTEVNRRSFERDEWEFVGVIVVNEVNGRDDSVWGVEFGTLEPDLSISLSDIASRDDIVDMCRGLL